MGARLLRERILDDELLVTPEIFDALSARIAEDVGFEAAILGGFAASSTLGIPEPVLTMSEMRDHAHAVTYATNLPFVVDGTTGFGNAAHTYRSVREFARAGVAGVFIEDQVAPSQLSYTGTPLELVPVEEMEAKIRAAVRARDEGDEDIVVLAKTQAATKDRREFETMEDAVERLNRYFDAGAELGCLYPRTAEEAAYVVEHADGPLKFAVVPGKPFQPSFAEVAELGYAVANAPTATTIAAVTHVRNYYETLYETGEFTVNGDDIDEGTSYVKDLLFDRYERYE